MTTTTTRPPRRKDGPALLKSGKLNRTRTGETFDRSVSLLPTDAKRIATALAALPGFRDVRALSTKHRAADGRTWFVRWHRDAEEFVSSRSEQIRDIRVERAAHQAREMEWFLASDDTESTSRWCLHYYPDTDLFGLYLVSLAACECPDYGYRLAGSGLSCKHMNALRMHLRIPVAVPVGFYQGLPKAEIRERLKRDRDLDFP